MSTENSNEQVMPVWEMHSSNDFCLGKTIPLNQREPYKKVFLNINSDNSPNGNTVIVGMSGSYKTTFLKEMARDFTSKGMNVHEIDLQGDMFIPEENICIKIYANKRNDAINYGINIFEFDKYVGGPKSNSRVIVNVIKKSIGSLGVLQSAVLTRLIRDFYKYSGIDENDMSTWNKQTPTMRDFVEFYHLIVKKAKNEEDIFEKLSKKIDKLNYKLIQMENDSSCDDDDLDKISKKIQNLNDELSNVATTYSQYSYDSLKGSKHNQRIKHEAEIELDYYKDKKVFQSLDGLSYLIEEFSSEIIFHGETIQLHNEGLIRYDLSELTTEGKPTSAILFVEILLNQIFRFTKSRGLYSKLKTKKKGKKYDTVIVMDESKLTLPTGGDKDNSFVLQHRIVSEGRKYGLCAIWASQMGKSFSREILMNSANKIILKIEPIQRKELAKQFGIENPELLEYTKITGAALVDLGDNNFIPIALPFANKNSFNKKSVQARPF